MFKNKIVRNVVAISLSGLLVSFTGTPAALAADFSLKVDSLSQLKALGDTVTSTITGLAEDQGVYVRLCAVPTELATNSAARPTQCDGQGKWVSNLMASQLIGAGKASEAVKLDVKAVFTVKDETIDCTKVSCAIHTRRDHFGGANDFALDRYFPVSFGPATASAALKASRLTVIVKGAAGKTITFTVAKKAYKRPITGQNYVFSLSSKASTLQVEVKLDGKTLLAKNLKRQ